jgi:hypothetical protein
MGDLGDELSQHRLRLAPVAGRFAATVAGVCCLAALHPVAAALALVPLGLLVWMLVTRGRDRLTVYRDGFALRHRGKVRRCRWDDIDEVDIQPGDDRRGRIRAVTGRDGERIAFAGLMGGLDVLYYAYVTEGGRITPAAAVRSGGGIGTLLSTHGAARARGYLPAIILGGVLLLFALVMVYLSLAVPGIDAHDVWVAVGCTATALWFVALLLWLALADRGDELRVHEHGFAYRRRGVVQECRWDEIVDYERRRGNLTGVKKDDGTWISLSFNVPGVRQYVAPRVRTTINPHPPVTFRHFGTDG